MGASVPELTREGDVRPETISRRRNHPRDRGNLREKRENIIEKKLNEKDPLGRPNSTRVSEKGPGRNYFLGVSPPSKRATRKFF